MADRELGVAFSGGGIRSAAFCSGVLRRLIRKGKEPDVLSCVSGGGYTGSAYVEWKYRNLRKQDQAKWRDEFFDHMRTHTSHFCNWQNCGEGFCDSIILGALLLFVAIIVPIAGWGSFAFPIAFMVKFLYGQFLDGTQCRRDANGVDCQERTILFAVSVGVFAGFHLVEYFVNRCEDKENYLKMKVPKVVLKFGQMISGATFAFTFLPWFVEDYLRFTHLAKQIAIVVATAVFWFFVPLLRKYSSLVILIYGYSYVVSWHVYKSELFTITYTKERFEKCMIASLVILAVFSVLGDFPLRLIHIYNRWRLQKAFYNHDEKDKKSCCCCSYEEQCCYCYDIFPGGHCSPRCCTSCICPPTRNQSETADTRGQTDGDSNRNDDTPSRALTLGDLIHIKPQYISNMVVNGWRRKYKQKYCLLAMSPKGISVIDQQPALTSTVVQIGNELTPSDIKLSSAMAMSAAALSPYLGKYEITEQGLTHILTVCGLEMAANIVYDMNGERSEHCCAPFRLYVANLIILAAISVGGVLGVLEMLKSSFPVSSVPVVITSSVVGGILAFLLVILVLLCLKNVCSSSPDCCPNTLRSCSSNLSKLSRWCVVHLPIYRFVRSILNIITSGPTPPAMLHLSDGGHFENYGLLPLLKLRLPKILVVDGSKIESEDDYAKGIIQAMEEARELFDCSFTTITKNGSNGGDVLTDIKNKFVKPEDRRNLQRKYEFMVHYSEKEDAVGDNANGVSKGHIVLISPRPPTESVEIIAPGPPPSREGDASASEENPSGPDNRRSSVESWVNIALAPPADGHPWEGDASTSDENPQAWRSDKCEGKELDENWGPGPYLIKDDVERIGGCPGGFGCCECCHRPPWCGSFFAFPRHPTGNQFFTPRMFTAYHREGYRACMECDDFLLS